MCLRIFLIEKIGFLDNKNIENIKNIVEHNFTAYFA